MVVYKCIRPQQPSHILNASRRMKKLSYRNPHFAPTIYALSLQNRLSPHSKTKADLIEKLRGCIDVSTATSIHTQILKLGFLNVTFIANHLINCYVRLGEIGNARKVFNEMPEPNVVSWTSVISGYNEACQPRVVLKMFGDMNRGLVWPNEFTFASAVKACSAIADVRNGRKIHARIEIFGFQDNLVVCSSVIDMYGKCNDVESARRVFDLMGNDKNIVSWTSMITAYVQNGLGNEALELYREYNVLMSDRPNQFMLASVISACASLGRLQWGRVAHGLVVRGVHESNDVVASALVDMYAKCGNIDYSNKVFKRIQNPSVIPYTSMIMGAAKYGLGKLPFELFEEMVSKGIKPNSVTFLGVLHACSHSGLINEGIEFLNSMYKKHGVSPDPKHYTCVVDMLGRTGRVDEAYNLAKSINLSPEEGALLWGSLLSTSRLHGRVDIAVEASKKLIGSNQQVMGAYVMLSNAYASAGGWEDSHSIRHEMKCNGIYKEPGCSWIELKDSTHVFYSGDLSFDLSGEMVNLLRELERRMKEKGYRETSTQGLVFVDVDEEAREEMVSLHSERLALAFGLISLPKGVTIRIMKNLRMCGDCHEAFKLISEIVERDFVVRDVNRFHHFRNGSCSCKDFW